MVDVGVNGSGGTAVAQALPKLCSCVGVRSCALCSDPALREAHGLHPIRGPEAPGAAEALDAQVGWLYFDAASGAYADNRDPVAMVRFDDGRPSLRADKLPVPFEGFKLLHDVIKTEDEEAEILRQIEAWPWQASQSGRWKQDFGPRANFKRQLVKVPADWQGIPSYAHDLLSQLRGQPGGSCSSTSGAASDGEMYMSPAAGSNGETCSSPAAVAQLLADFEVAEFLTLRYDQERGANHALHTDDTWLWGDRIIGVSLGAASVFTFYEPGQRLAIRVPLPRRSAYILSGSCRHHWQHGLLAQDIVASRYALTYRELTPALADTEVGQLARDRAKLTAAPPAKPPGESSASDLATRSPSVE